MQKIIFYVTLCFLFILNSSFSYFKNAGINSPETIQATAYSPAIPVLKGVSANPILRVAVSIPSEKKEQFYQKVNCTINAQVISSIEKIDVYLTGGEPFSTQQLISSIVPSASLFDIPLNIKLRPGVHFIWFSIVLKSEAAIDHKIKLTCQKLTDNKGNQLLVQQGKSVYDKHIGVVVRKAGADQVNTYRIPGIVTTDKGTLLSVYDIRYKNSSDLPGNIDVGLSRSIDSGKTWQPMKVIMDMGAPHENNGVGDPSILFDPITKKIWVAALWSKGNRSIAGSLPGISPDTTGQFVLVSSDDDGLTWSNPYTITPQIKDKAWHLFFNGPGSGIAMQDGKLVFAAQYWNENKVPFSTIIYSADHGNSWNGKINGPKSNTTESQVVETTSGILMLNMRDNRGGFRSVATTNNLGVTWTEHATSYNALPDPVCMASLIKARVKVKGVMRDVLFFSNPNTTAGRYNMTIKASLDYGQTWLPAHQLLVDERQGYGYSSLTQIDDHTIGILYEGIKDLYFLKIQVNEIIK